MRSAIRFMRAAGTVGLGSVSLAIVLFAISIYEHLRDKNVPAYWLLFAAAVSFCFGAYRAWASEHEALTREVGKNVKPLLKIELAGSLFDVAKVPHRNELQVHVFAYLKVTNRHDPETLIKDGTLVMTVDGTRYVGKGDDNSVKGNAIEHVSGLRIGGEVAGKDVFGGNTLSPLRRLLDTVNADNPLRRGITREGFFVFTFTDLQDWNRSNDPETTNPYLIRVSDFVLTLRDSFDGEHTLERMFLDIPQGRLTTVALFPRKSLSSTYNVKDRS